MLSLSPQASIFIAVSPVNFRLGIDGLAQCCRAILNQDPMAGTMFVFRNRKRTAIKILTYDGQGYILVYKRLSAGHLQWWPTDSASSQPVLARDLHILFNNGDPALANMAEDWRSVTPPVSLSSPSVFADKSRVTTHGG